MKTAKPVIIFITFIIPGLIIVQKQTPVITNYIPVTVKMSRVALILIIAGGVFVVRAVIVLIEEAKEITRASTHKIRAYLHV